MAPAASNTSATTPEAAQEALKKTKNSLLDIRTRMKPFLKQITDAARVRNSSHSTKSSPSTALAQSAVALSVGTLQVIGARLRGKEEGKHDPLRLQLNQCRAVLVQLQQKQAEIEKKQQNEKEEAAKKVAADKMDPLSGSKRKEAPKQTPPEAANTELDHKPSPGKKQKRKNRR